MAEMKPAGAGGGPSPGPGAGGSLASEEPLSGQAWIDSLPTIVAQAVKELNAAVLSSFYATVACICHYHSRVGNCREGI